MSQSIKEQLKTKTASDLFLFITATNEILHDPSNICNYTQDSKNIILKGLQQWFDTSVVLDNDLEELSDAYWKWYDKNENEKESLRISLQDSTSPIISTPHELGIIGETKIATMIERLKPKFDVTIVSAQGHVADIHVIDVENAIRYVIEVKNKQKITSEDLTKFDSDIQNMNKDVSLKNIGMFISTQTHTIIGVGAFGITSNKIYITQKYITDECFNLIFDYAPLIESTKSISAGVDKEKTEFIIPQNVYNLIANLHLIHSHTEMEISKMEEMRKTHHSLIVALDEMMTKKLVSQKIISEIFKEFPSGIMSNDTLEDNYHNKLREYLKSRTIKQIKKVEILTAFPMLKTELSKMKLDELIEKYRE